MDACILERRRMSNLINIWDDYVDNVREDFSDVEQQTIDFFLHGSELVFPAKSVFVAIIYAKCMEDFFHIDFYSALDDEDLLENDRYFTVYSKNKEIYDRIIERIHKDSILNYASTEKTVDYFKKEFLV